MTKVRIFLPLLCAAMICACQPVASPPAAQEASSPPIRTSSPVGVPEMQIEAAPDMRLNFYLDPERWRVAEQPPEYLVDDVAEHLEHELEDQGKHPSEKELVQLARERLRNNEAFVFNPETGAHLDVDSSKLREGESVPSAYAIQRSAEYAGESLGSEEGVSDVSYKTENIEIQGAHAATFLDASFRHHDEPRRFLGVIAFADSHWLFLYYTDPLRDEGDYEAMETALRTFSIRTKGGLVE